MRRGLPVSRLDPSGRVRSAFTLIELLVAAALAAVLMMTAVPFAREVRKDPLVRAVNTLVEGCREARLKAILKDRPMQLVIFENGGAVGVEPVPDHPISWKTTSASAELRPSIGDSSPADSSPTDAKRIDDEVAFRQLVVNGQDMMTSDAAVIRFFPNGTSDALIAELQWLRRGVRRVSLDIMTGQPIVEGLP
jgi:prepilin-type N-terminal cleavage/methylation domain-containing protein